MQVIHMLNTLIWLYLVRHFFSFSVLFENGNCLVIKPFRPFKILFSYTIHLYQHHLLHFIESENIQTGAFWPGFCGIFVLKWTSVTSLNKVHICIVHYEVRADMIKFTELAPRRFSLLVAMSVCQSHLGNYTSW